DISQPDQRRDIARISHIHVFALTAMNNHQPAYSLASARARIVNRFALPQLPGIDAEEHELSGIRISPQLESERAELGIVIWFDDDLVLRARFESLRGRNIQRRRKIID